MIEKDACFYHVEELLDRVLTNKITKFTEVITSCDTAWVGLFFRS